MINKCISALSLATFLASTAFSTVPDSGKIKIAITGPFTGGSASMGVSLRDGAKMAVDEINEAGGVEVGDKKFKIEVVERDDEANNQRGLQIAQELSDMQDLSAIIGQSNTGVVLAAEKFLLDNKTKKIKIITGSTGTTIPKQWKESGTDDLYLFRLAATDAVQTKLIVDEAVNRLKAKKVAIIHDTSNYGVAGHDDLVKNLENYPDVKIVATEKFKVGDKDMTPQVTAMQKEGAEVVLIYGIGPELAQVTLAMKKLEFKVPVIGSWTLSMGSYLDNAGDSSNGVRLVQTFLESPYSKKAEKFINNYHKKYNVKRIESPMSAVQAYDSVKILAAAFHEAGTLDTPKVKDTLENLSKPVEGVITNWNKPFAKWDSKNPDPQVHEAMKKDVFFVGTIKDGKIEFINKEDEERMRKIADGETK